MNGRKYSYYVLLVLTAVFAITNLISYLQAGLNNPDAFANNWMTLLITVFFFLALFLMPKKNAFGWGCCLVGMVILAVQALMGLQSAGITGVTELCLDLFVIFYLLDDYILRMFGME